MLMAAEMDVTLATGWERDYILDMEAEYLICLHLRWQVNQVRYSGFMGAASGTASASEGASPRASDDRFKSKTWTEGNKTTMRININDLFESDVAARVNQAGRGRT